jgi:hypothetical protein
VTGVPDGLVDAKVRTAVLEVSATAGLVRVPGVATYLAIPHQPVRIAPELTAHEADVACFLNSTVRAIELLLHREFAFRGVALRMGEWGVVICGPPAVGTSALAAQLALRGHSVLADPVVSVSGGDQPQVHPSSAEVELWPAMAKQLGLASGEGWPVRPALAKRSYRLGKVGSGPVPLQAVFVLGSDPRIDVPVRTCVLGGAAKVQALLAWVWHRRIIGPLDLAAEHFHWLTSVADRATVVRLTRPRHGHSVQRLAELVEETVACLT